MTAHSVVWSHDADCNHDRGWCEPDPQFTCHAPTDVPGCRFYCSGDCEEWSECGCPGGDGHPADPHCYAGHPLQTGPCQALEWIEGDGWQDTGPEYLNVYRDGPIEVEYDGAWTWHYAPAEVTA